MGTLADAFLEDLEDLERDDFEGEADTEVVNGGGKAENYYSDEESPIIDAVEEYFNLAGSPENDFSPMIKDPRINSIVEKAKLLTLKGDVSASEMGFIEDCNKTVLEIDNEIINIYNHVRDIYSKRFPKLESIVYSPLDYIAVVKRAKTESDFTKVDLTDLLPNTTIMAITVASTMSSVSSLSSQILNKALSACNEGMLLAEFRNDILVYLESRMSLLAPNVCMILGSALTARLITQAGGLASLAKMPSQNIMLIGSDRRGVIIPGIIYSCEIIQNAVPSVKNRAVKLVSGKVSLAAKVDLFKEYTNGEMGLNYRNFILKSLLKAQEPPPAPMKKSLPVPEEKKGNKRGGKRYRKMKERYAIGEYRKQANRLKFGEEAEDDYGLEMDDGMGMLGKSSGHGRMIIQPKQTKIHIPKKRQISMQSSGATNGMSSSLIFTPFQGIELCNPDAAKKVSKGTTSSILDNTRGFLKVAKKEV
ncbi:U4/U6 snRNP-associated protein, putative [Theileria equi strain WA]|uniref:U4/U6 snRNP-associated protein, putative n=1 Tax=Theileria equi strain WA TaxID=1537102 RepID=L0AVH6_THEEQ|nr:U4/U6 snRNP-associated protein, putative [Theileria equi strain WA]AFZ79550.1 U4/U6 snRNP-associated protein, putative [Theileria equi strain WA]|eukprot:XP_004829216.1 U4/U6 snRNP-associated protein, putative [Theileria equi strain WA]